MLIKMNERTIRSGCKKCGSTSVYWAKDSETNRFVMIDANDFTRSAAKGGLVLDLYRHDCDGTVPESRETIPTDDDEHTDDTATDKAPSPAPKPAKVEESTDKTDAALSALRELLSPSVNREDVVSIIRDELSRVVFPVRTVVERANGETRKVEGLTHAKLADITTDILAGEHVLMVGPAGTGKSTIAEQAATALGLPFYSISLSPQTSAAQIIGYMQAAGEYVRTLFREAYEHGGVFHFDEFDNGHPSVLALVNASLANGHMAFPDGMVKRHDDFRAIASANTYGRGPDRQYVGRQALDAATLDRFSVETIDIDTALERSLCLGTGLDERTVSDVLDYVYKLRENADAHKLPVVVSPRASVGMCRLLHAGRHWADVELARARRGLSEGDWTKLSQGAPKVRVSS